MEGFSLVSPSEALKADREAFEEDLASLISDAAHASSTISDVESPPSPYLDGRYKDVHSSWRARTRTPELKALVIDHQRNITSLHRKAPNSVSPDEAAHEANMARLHRETEELEELLRQKQKARKQKQHQQLAPAPAPAPSPPPAVSSYYSQDDYTVLRQANDRARRMSAADKYSIFKPLLPLTGVNVTAVASATSIIRPAGTGRAAGTILPPNDPIIHLASDPHSQREAVVQRQRNPEIDLPYEDLLRVRRTERILGVDRYVPSPYGRDLQEVPRKLIASAPVQQSFPFERLPEHIKVDIYRLLLVSRDPIRIDYDWLRSSISRCVTIPTAKYEIKHQNKTYHLPLTWDEIDGSTRMMKKSWAHHNPEMEQLVRRQKRIGNGLTPQLLRVSTRIEDIASQVFYSENTFCFPSSSTAWIQLASFLRTIGPKNVANLRKLQVHVPIWCHGPAEDHINGLVFDLTSTTSRLVTLRDSSRDRLLFAVQMAMRLLQKVSQLTSFDLLVDFPRPFYSWIDRDLYRHVTLFRQADLAELMARKSKAESVLSAFSTKLKAKPTVNVIPTDGNNEKTLGTFRNRLQDLEAEAAKYGWTVNPVLGRIGGKDAMDTM